MTVKETNGLMLMNCDDEKQQSVKFFLTNNFLNMKRHENELIDRHSAFNNKIIQDMK